MMSNVDIDSSPKIHLPNCVHSPLFLPWSMCLVLSHFVSMLILGGKNNNNKKKGKKA
jgi:hypothetical protein